MGLDEPEALVDPARNLRKEVGRARVVESPDAFSSWIMASDFRVQCFVVCRFRAFETATS
jgi:hypothetical protein